ncbi:MAG: anaerobic ribonucleoside-triphosphate reductase [Erysipelotrichaceae bacterium]|nr:anaerobic ribonucleoside-triphosphate reductase [Erysipelotrichaceae bacterium]
MKIIKRDCSEVDFNKSKIYEAIMKAMTFGSGIIKPTIAKEIADEIEMEVQGVQDLDIYIVESMVFDKLIAKGENLTAKSYEGYRRVREFQRDVKNSTDESVIELLEGKSEYWNEENSNKNAMLVTTQRDYMAGIESEDISKRMLLTPDIIQAHEDGIIHFHDMDYFGQNATHNCDLINLEDMLQNGTVISNVMIEKPHSFSTACNVATQIIAQVASSQYGGQSISLTHLAPFVDVSRKEIREEVEYEIGLCSGNPEMIDTITEERLKREINKGVQTIQYQVVTLMTTNGQAPFLSIFMYLNEAKDEQTKKDLALIIEEVLKQRIQGVKNEKGIWVTPAFPKLLYVLEKDNVYKDSKYFYLTKLAAECSAKRLVPDYISEKKMLEYKVDKNGNGNCYPCMGCRSFLTPYVDENGEPKYYGRFNQGVVTINLPDIALSSGGDFDTFWQLFEARTELCHKALQLRHKRLENTPSDVAPILWQHGTLARLQKGEVIDKLLHNGYSTISLGYAGLYECVKYMTGHSHTDGSIGEKFGLEVMQALNDKCAQWKEAEHIDYSLYGSPIESTTYKFAKCLKKRFGIIEGITDRNYITNSYHVPVFEEINAFDKLELEAKFQKLSPGGAISYVEIPNMNDNLEAIIQLVQFIYNNIMYAELNSKSDYCMVCGYDKEIKIITDEKTGKLIWECPNCHNRDQNKMSVARRTCGYIGTNFWNQGRTQEIQERVLHIDDKAFDDGE